MGKLLSTSSSIGVGAKGCHRAERVRSKVSIIRQWTAAEQADNSASWTANTYPETMQPIPTAAMPIDMITSVRAIPEQEFRHPDLLGVVRFIL